MTQLAFPRCDVRDVEALLWVHVSLLSLTGVLIVASFLSQFKDAAPYGKHATPEKSKAWGFPIPQRVGHIISDFFPCIPFFLAVYLSYAGRLPLSGPFSEVDAANIVLILGWLLHYVHRGLIHPLIMPYSSKTVAVGITLAGIFPNTLFGFLIAAQLGCTIYPEDWLRQPRFIIGIIVYALGFFTNRWADLKLRNLRLQAAHNAELVRVSSKAQLAAASQNSDKDNHEQSSDGKYFIPHGGLYELVSCPNYLGEGVQWFGYAIACWSWPTLAWALFGASTFIPRSLTNHRWYKATFPNYPAHRKALIPFIL